MDRFPLNSIQVSAIDEALEKDDATNLIAVLDNAIQTSGWAAESKLCLGVESIDAVWHIASKGKPKCFEAIVEFIFRLPDWYQLPEHLRDGRYSGPTL